MSQRMFPAATGHVPPGAIGHNRGIVRRNYAFVPPEGVLVSRPRNIRERLRASSQPRFWVPVLLNTSSRLRLVAEPRLRSAKMASSTSSMC